MNVIADLYNIVLGISVSTLYPVIITQGASCVVSYKENTQKILKKSNDIVQFKVNL